MNMPKLTKEQIEEFASRPGVRRIAVMNFLGTVDANKQQSAFGATQNLYYDADLYSWNDATISAIREGIELHFKPESKGKPIRQESLLEWLQEIARENGDSAEATSSLSLLIFLLAQL